MTTAGGWLTGWQSAPRSKNESVTREMDSGLDAIYRLLGCCWYSGQGPRWIGRRAPPAGGESSGAGSHVEQQVPAALGGSLACAPSVSETCAGGPGLLSADKSLRYETLSEEHIDEVLQLLVHSFFREEPLGLAAGVRSPEHVRRWLPDFVRPVARQGVSSVCLEAESGRVVGVSLCHLAADKHDSPLMAALDPARDTAMMVVAQFLADLHLGLQEENAALSLLVLNVERHFCGRGVAAELVRRSEAAALRRGLTYVTADTTGEFSYKTFCRLGYHVIREMQYDESPQLNPGPVHNAARVMIKHLSNETYRTDKTRQ